MSEPIYLDYAAATPMDPLVFAAMQPYFTQKFYNPSATYLVAQSVKKDLQEARRDVAHWLGARPSEIIFTAGATEANNLVIHGVMQQFPEGNLIVSAIEHDSVLEPARRYIHHEAKVDAKGSVDLEDISRSIDDNTVLVSIMYANNEVGTIQQLTKISTIIQHVRRDRQARNIVRPLYFHTDAAQAANYLDLHTARLGVDFMSLNGGKMYGPKQSGVLFVGSHVTLVPQIMGGGQERGLRSGTENITGSIGLAKALSIAQEKRSEEAHRLQTLQTLFIRELQQNIPNVIVNGSSKRRLPNNVHITIPGSDNERILMALDEMGIMCAAGSACSASNEEPSHVLRAIGVSDQDAQSSLRFTMGRQTTEEVIHTTVAALTRLVA